MVVSIVFPLKRTILRSQRQALLTLGDQLSAYGQLPKDSDSLSEFAVGTGLTQPYSRSEPQSDWMRWMLFPTEYDGRLQTKLRNVPYRALFDPVVDYEQAHAVNSVCKLDYGTFPYLISGPPGTRKTTTLVEMAM